jgi:hypothetical protein
MNFYGNEYMVNSNNSINDNIYNTEKLKKSSKYKIKKILKPFINILSSNKKPKNSKYVCKCQHSSSLESNDFDYSSEIYDNQSNEKLENKIMDEIRNCGENSAIFAYNGENSYDLVPITNDQVYVPVHFARVPGSGTFFWTTIKRRVDYDLEEGEYYSGNQLPQLQAHHYDRWVQA